jgi:protein involved in polysaccharide export with SLBB domain
MILGYSPRAFLTMNSLGYMEMRLLLALLACLSFATVRAAEAGAANASATTATNNAAAPRTADDALSILRNAVETSGVAKTEATAVVAAAPTVARTNLVVGPVEVLDDKIKLNSGDMLRFKIVEDREDPKGVMVTDAGDIDFPYIGPIPAKGRTCKEIAEDARKRYEADYYYSATVSLAVDRVARKSTGRIWVMGQVGSQGPQEIPADEPWTVSKAILRSGGFNDFANDKKVRLFRKSKGPDFGSRKARMGSKKPS